MPRVRNPFRVRPPKFPRPLKYDRNLMLQEGEAERHGVMTGIAGFAGRRGAGHALPPEQEGPAHQGAVHAARLPWPPRSPTSCRPRTRASSRTHNRAAPASNGSCAGTCPLAPQQPRHRLPLRSPARRDRPLHTPDQAGLHRRRTHGRRRHRRPPGAGRPALGPRQDTQRLRHDGRHTPALPGPRRPAARRPSPRPGAPTTPSRCWASSTSTPGRRARGEMQGGTPPALPHTRRRGLARSATPAPEDLAVRTPAKIDVCS
jgi:hypothetical protein